MKTPALNALVFIALLAIAAGSRLLNLAPNFAAVTAVALFAGWYFRSPLIALGAMLSAMLISDAFLGWYEWRLMFVVYAASVLPLFLGRALALVLPGRARIATMAGALGLAIACSIAFFFITNFAVWAFSADVAYPKTLAGLADCFTKAIPFFRYTLASDAFFTTVLFGTAAVFSRAALRSPERTTRTA